MHTVSINRTLSSRATIAAGTRPPRVIATITVNGPAAASRHASALASRWNWSHDTGNAFSGNACGCAIIPPALLPLPYVQNEIELRGETVARIRDAHQELAAEQRVAAV